jgi:hypothetical protein
VHPLFTYHGYPRFAGLPLLAVAERMNFQARRVARVCQCALRSCTVVSSYRSTSSARRYCLRRPTFPRLPPRPPPVASASDSRRTSPRQCARPVTTRWPHMASSSNSSMRSARCARWMARFQSRARRQRHRPRRQGRDVARDPARAKGSRHELRPTQGHQALGRTDGVESREGPRPRSGCAPRSPWTGSNRLLKGAPLTRRRERARAASKRPRRCLPSGRRPSHDVAPLPDSPEAHGVRHRRASSSCARPRRR